MENSNLKFYDNDTEKFLTEEQIRWQNFMENLQDLERNKVEYFKGMYNINDCVEEMKNAQNGDIQKIVESLNKLWGYNISILKEV